MKMDYLLLALAALLTFRVLVGVFWPKPKPATAATAGDYGRTDREIDMDAVVAALKDQGVPAYVEMTGGGVATIYAGEPWSMPYTTHDGKPSSYLEYPVLAGPGWFEGPGYTIARASTAEFYIGTEDAADYEDGFYVTVSDEQTDEDTTTMCVRLIVEAIAKYHQTDHDTTTKGGD